MVPYLGRYYWYYKGVDMYCTVQYRTGRQKKGRGRAGEQVRQAEAGRQGSRHDRNQGGRENKTKRVWDKKLFFPAHGLHGRR